MVKRISECSDCWADLQTLAIADQLCADDFASVVSNCTTMNDFETGAKEVVMNKINVCKSDSDNICLDPNDNMQLLILAALDNVDIDKIVQAAASCFPLEIRLYQLESKMNNICKLIEEQKPSRAGKITNERGDTPVHDGEVAAMDIATKFDKDDLDIDSDVDVKNKKDAWILRLVYNDGNKENLSMVKPNDNKDDYVMTSDKDKLKVKFSDDPEDGTFNVPQTVIDHIAKHIEQAEKNAENSKKNNDSDLAHEIAYDIKKEFPNYNMEIIEGDIGDKKWTIEIVYKNGDKDRFTINKIGKSYIMKSNDFFIAKFTLDELKNFPKKLKSHIANHIQKSSKQCGCKMNQKEWRYLRDNHKELLDFTRYNNTRKIQKSLQYNTNQDVIVIHHLRDTEEQRKYNDDHYKLWGFEIDENGNEHFEYGKYIIFVTPEEHAEIHSCSEETRKKRSESLKSNPPMKGKHHADETKEKMSNSAKNRSPVSDDTKIK